MTEENKKPQKVIIRPTKKKTISPVRKIDESYEKVQNTSDTFKPPPRPKDKSEEE